MKATPLLIAWHDDNAPVYSVHFDPHGKGRLATAGNDNNVRLWRVEATGEERKITYLSTLVKHTQAVNVVRFSPKGEMLASAGDDGNVLLWVPSELQTHSRLGEDRADDKETWRVKHMCRSSGAEIYDLAWSPDGVFFITGSMDNVARIYNAQTGQMVRQIAEHSHYVQGVAWDPLNEYVATQSSDRSVHIYTLKTKDGQFTLTSHGKFLKMDLPARRISSNSPAPPDMGLRNQSTTSNSVAVSSPGPSTPGTPMTGLPMDPPPMSLSRRSSFGSSPSIRRSASPAPSMPLPAVKPLDMPSPSFLGGLGVKNSSLYANETFTSFFRRLTFAPDGSLLFTPAGQYKMPLQGDPSKGAEDVTNTVYIYTRARFNKPPIAHLPGHKKPSIAVKCSPVFYTLRQGLKPTRHITLDTSSVDDSFASLPDSMMPPNLPPPISTSMEPPPLALPTPATSDPSRPLSLPKTQEQDASATNQPNPPAFSLPYRIVYAVATQDAVLVYDTQQQTPLCVVSNLHFATFTDLTWSQDGLTLIMSSSDGFCSTLSFTPGELGQTYSVEKQHVSTSTPSSATTPSHTSGSLSSPGIAKSTPAIPRPSGPVSPASSVAASIGHINMPPSNAGVFNNPTPTLSSVPSVTATNSAPPPNLSFTTPPQTPMTGVSHSARSSISGSVLGKRDLGAISESDKEDTKEPSEPVQQANDNGGATPRAPKRKRIAPTLISAGESTDNNVPESSSGKPAD
ncbi:Chromatin assembly factor 1 subunit [Ophidiomyces ophidiicola]|nr:Chromatin assembly factor 1 subunit [Ophidiomyces ophidiicola]KAI1926242.1 Chromatin assembly factor 1 subunit [Ophidiomyces ophidiicola]KAI1956937.1 Chromatin assembly factor 1 subunit [Ophidiomyces ophidiicola]KAI2023699.1 Chromatin assembly factor 1 subunit [Ophidiomyces ophidiicola]KAI2133836.1 Chromatin assembly factor 1 subunit [Ophidiomyces ophidiicola]